MVMLTSGSPSHDSLWWTDPTEPDPVMSESRTVWVPPSAETSVQVRSSESDGHHPVSASVGGGERPDDLPECGNE